MVPSHHLYPLLAACLASCVLFSPAHAAVVKFTYSFSAADTAAEIEGGRIFRVFRSQKMFKHNEGPGSATYEPLVALEAMVSFKSGGKHVKGEALAGFFYQENPLDWGSGSVKTPGDLICNNKTGTFGAADWLLEQKRQKSNQRRSNTKKPNVLAAEHKIKKSGFYYPVIAACVSGSGVPVEFEGDVTWLNPYGYLPYTLYGFLPLYGILGIAYAVLAVLFGFKSVISRKNLLGLHVWIAIVALVGLFECIVWYFWYRKSNQMGDASCCPIPNEVRLAMVLGVFKKCVSSILLLIVSLGYGITRPRLGWSLGNIVALLAIISTGSSLIFQLQRLKHIEDDPTTTMTSFWKPFLRMCAT